MAVDDGKDFQRAISVDSIVIYRHIYMCVCVVVTVLLLLLYTSKV